MQRFQDEMGLLVRVASPRVLDDHLTIACGKGAIRVLQAQRAGKRPMTAEELLRGFALPAGTQL